MYEREWYDDPSRNHPVAIHFLKVTYSLGKSCHPTKVKLGKMYNFQANVIIIKKGLFATCSNASNIKVTLTTRLDVLPHEARLVVFLEPRWRNGHCFVVK
jgi:hypothetical protein